MHLKPLIISNNPFSNQTNNGKTLESIFNIFPKKNLSQLYFTEYLNPDFNFCDNYYKITDKDVLKNILLKKYGKKVENNFNINYSNNSIFLKNKEKYKVFHLVRDFIWSFNTWKSKNLYRWIESSKPDFIFFVAGGDKFSHNIALFLSRKFQLPLLTYFTDDYLLNERLNSNFDKYLHNRKIIYFRKLIQKSILCFAICDYMAEEYQNFFHKQFLTLINSIEINSEYEYKPNKTNKFIISYFGSLHTNRDVMLLKFSKIINSITTFEIQLNVYTNSIPDNDLLKKLELNSICYKGSLVGAQLIEAMKLSDFLLHIESDDSESISKTKLSVSTKIPEYLSTCRPIISYGPIAVASLKIQSDNNIGYVLNSENSNLENTELLINFFKSKETQMKISLNGFNFVKLKFNRTIQNELFKSKLYTIFSN